MAASMLGGFFKDMFRDRGPGSGEIQLVMTLMVGAAAIVVVPAVLAGANLGYNAGRKFEKLFINSETSEPLNTCAKIVTRSSGIAVGAVAGLVCMAAPYILRYFSPQSHENTAIKCALFATTAVSGAFLAYGWSGSSIISATTSACLLYGWPGGAVSLVASAFANETSRDAIKRAASVLFANPD